MGTKVVRRVAQIIAREQLGGPLREILEEYREQGHVDDDGDVAIIPLDPDELVSEAFRRAEYAGDRVVFVALMGERIVLRGMQRQPGNGCALSVTTHKMALGTTVREWFDRMDDTQGAAGWSVDSVPDTPAEIFAMVGHQTDVTLADA